MANEVMIVVRSKNDVKPGFDAADRDIQTFADKSGDTYNKRFGLKMQQLGAVVSAPLERAGKEIGDKLGTRAGEQFTQDLTRALNGLDGRTAAMAIRTGQQIGDRIGERAGEGVTKAIATNLGDGDTEMGAAAEKSGTDVGQRMGDRAGTKLLDRIRLAMRRVSSETSGESRVAGDRIGETMGSNIREKLTLKIREALARRFTAHVDTDVDTRGAKSVGIPGNGSSNSDTAKTGLSGRAEAIGKDIGDKVSGGIGASLQSFFSGDVISFILKGLAVAGLATALAPILGGAVITAFGLAFGGGILAAGIISAFRDPRIKGAAGDLKKQVTGLFDAFGRPFRAPIADFLEKLSRFLGSKQVINAAKQLSEAFAPIAGELGTGLIAMLQNMLPGFVALAKAAAPMFETLAKHLPQIGRALSSMFQAFADQGDDANVFFSDLLHFIEATLVILGKLISKFASAYSALRNLVVNGIRLFRDLGSMIGIVVGNMEQIFLRAISRILDILGALAAGAADAFGWIPGIGPKLRAAQDRFTAFRKKVNSELGGIKDKTVTIKIRQVFSTVGRIVSDIAGVIAGRASGGIIGAIGQAASGGIRNGLTMVGEHGPELADLPPGTNVHSNGDSRRMLGQGGGTVTLKFAPSGNAVLDDLFRWMLEHLQQTARTEYGSDSALMFGGGGQ